MAVLTRPDLPPPAPTIGRRLFLAGATGAAALLATQRAPGAWAAPGAWPDDPFRLGVASGDPTPTGVVLWTRLAPRPLDPDGGMPARPVPVDWVVATGPRLRDVVRRGRVTASPANAHAVHVEVDGLDPTRAAPSSATPSGAGCSAGWTVPRPAGTCSPSRW
jgi:phosphodiesterase/alkaline phosphatase D-like protein